jgi:hypothetical protein
LGVLQTLPGHQIVPHRNRLTELFSPISFAIKELPLLACISGAIIH